MTQKQKILRINLVILIMLAILLLSINLVNKPHADILSSKADVTLKATTLLNAFLNNETEANTKYLEQIIEVNGTISELSTEDEKGVITLSDKNAFGSIMCHLDTEESKKINSLRTGQNITIKGVCTGYLMDVVLIKCVILDKS